jgi:ectoine hydroxylase-related dioxygenase (phytanoyl-CoA dioxygenase family)
MLKRVDSLNFHSHALVASEATAIQEDGHYIMRGVFGAEEVAAMRAELESVYERVPPEMRDSAFSREVGEMYRYQVFHHSPLCQRAIADARILEVIEPLLGGDCHVISCTSWRNPPGESLTPHGLQWHIDGGPFIPREEGTDWPSHIPYPVFIIGTHIYLQDVQLEDGPTMCIPGSHKSGLVPPSEQLWDLNLSYAGRKGVCHVAKAGDVDFRVSDVWHRRRPPSILSKGRFFLQTNYARRDIAQRVLPTNMVSHASPESLARCASERERRLLGLHPQSYFDA